MISVRRRLCGDGRATVTLLLICFNAVIWLHQQMLEKSGQEIASDYGLISWRFVNAAYFPPWQGGIMENAVLPLLTSMLMHSSFRHLISNSFFLWVFGSGLEKRFGHIRFLGFYFVCGLGASVGHVILDPHCMLPIIGASGAIAGLAGAQIVFFSRSRIPISIGKHSVNIPALFFVALFLLGGALTNAALCMFIPHANPPYIGHYLHAGGLITGIALAAASKTLKSASRDGSASDS